MIRRERWLLRVLPLALTVAALASRSHGASLPAVASHPSPSPMRRIDYEGTLLFEGDYRRPGELHVYHSRQTYLTDGADRARLDWTTWQDGDTVLPETYLLLGDSVFHRDSPGRPWRRFAGRAQQQARVLACAGLPVSLQRVARSLGDPRVELHTTSGRLVRYTRPQAHPRLGDVFDSVTYAYRGVDPVPDSMSMAMYSRDENWRLTQHRVAWSGESIADSLFTVPENVSPPRAHEMLDTLTDAPVLVEIAPHVWSADLNDVGSRTLIVEFADHLRSSKQQ